MDFMNAVKLAGNNEHLIGKEYLGEKIDDILIIPTDINKREDYIDRYNKSLNGKESIAPFIDSEVEVYILINKKYIRTANLFAITDIKNLPLEMNVNLN